MIQIEELMRIAKENGASDVHITVGIPPKMRVNGELICMDFKSLCPSDTESMLFDVMTEKQRKSLLENGEADFSFSIPKLGRYRVNAFKQRGSLAASLRLVGTTIPDENTLRMPKAVVDLYKKKKGLVLVTGPTGSGKSTTLAVLLNKINENVNTHIITLEDPIEYLHHHNKAIVNQREIGLDTGSYASALRAALREDPDIIFVGELCDLETIRIAITAAETGHLVFSTLHTIGAANTIERIVDMFPPHQQQQVRIQLATVLEAVVSQQLIPTSNREGIVAAFEVMEANLSIKNLIREGKTYQINSIIQADKMSMQTMDDAIYELYIRGEIDKEQALMYAQDISTLVTKLI